MRPLRRRGGGPVTPPLRHHRAFGYGVAALIAVLDQAIKWVLVGPIELRLVRTIEVVPVFAFNYVENRGISLGFLQSSGAARWALVALTVAIGAGVAVWLWRERVRGEVAALALVLGGAVGNIVDRARLGYVIDYADLHFGQWRPFYIFNLADAAITIGVVILLVRALFAPGKAKVETTNA